MTDIELAKNLNAKGIFINNKTNLGVDEVSVSHRELQSFIALETDNWKDIYEFLKLKERSVEISRKTKETDIYIKLNLDGKGRSQIDTGLKFFDHMLDQIARHGNMDLEIKVKGDLATFNNLAFTVCKNISHGLIAATVNRPPQKKQLLLG